MLLPPLLFLSKLRCVFCPQVTHFAVVQHLSGFYFIAAGDVERRVLPLLAKLESDTARRETCKTAAESADTSEVEKAQACCEHYGTPNDHLCRISSAGDSPSAGKPIITFELFCENAAGASSGEDYNACIGRDTRETCISVEVGVESVSGCCPPEARPGCSVNAGTPNAGKSIATLPLLCEHTVGASSGKEFDRCADRSAVGPDLEAQLGRVREASINWKSTLERNYQLLRRVTEANKAAFPSEALEALCPEPQNSRHFLPHAEVVNDGDGSRALELDNARQICPMTGMAPVYLISNTHDHVGNAQSDTAKQEMREYNVLSFGGGVGGIDYSFDPGGEVGNDITQSDEKHDQSVSYGLGLKYKFDLFGVGTEGEVDGKGTYQIAKMRTTVSTYSQASTASFHLEDGDIGDYFVVQVWY